MSREVFFYEWKESSSHAKEADASQLIPAKEKRMEDRNLSLATTYHKRESPISLLYDNSKLWNVTGVAIS